jgi:hypothetical protein
VGARNLGATATVRAVKRSERSGRSGRREFTRTRDIISCVAFTVSSGGSGKQKVGELKVGLCYLIGSRLPVVPVRLKKIAGLGGLVAELDSLVGPIIQGFSAGSLTYVGVSGFGDGGSPGSEDDR